MTQEEFEQWINNAHMCAKKTFPGVWGGSKEEIAEWDRNPYEHPYTAGAYDLLRHLEKSK